MSNENYVEAAAALQTVRSLAPREPPVYTLLGKVYQKLDKKDEAIIYYQYAIDLDPKEAVEIKVRYIYQAVIHMVTIYFLERNGNYRSS